MSKRVSRVCKYKQEEWEDEEMRDLLKLRAKEDLGVVAFNWQLDITEALFRGEDVVLDAGTGCGKSICFSLPLLLHKKDMALVVSPLSALMLDQVCRSSSSLPTHS